jgi:hypothetical protein
MFHIKSLKNYITEKYSASLGLKKWEWETIDPKKHPELQDEFFELITLAYSAIGGHSKVNSPSDVFKDKDWNFWKIIDVDADPEVDVVVFGEKSKYGIKYAGVGHDGGKDAKREYLDARGKDLKMKGYYGEVSLKFAEILLKKYKVPTVDNKEDVERVTGKSIEWHGEHPTDKSMPGKGWYTRTIGGHPHIKIMVGRPKI